MPVTFSHTRNKEAIRDDSGHLKLEKIWNDSHWLKLAWFEGKKKRIALID